MHNIQKIVSEGIESYLRHMITEDNQFGNGDGSAKAKLALKNTLKSLVEITLHYGEYETLDLEDGERYDFAINYSLFTDAYTSSEYSDVSGPTTYLNNDDTDDLRIESISALDKDTYEEIEIDDSDGKIEDQIREKYVVDDSDYDYPLEQDLFDYDE